MTGELPVSLHFNNDDSKAHYMEGDEIWSKVWWTRFHDPRFRDLIRERLRAGSIGFAHDGSAKRFVEICPAWMLGACARKHGGAQR
jgi:hypothetical protein